MRASHNQSGFTAVELLVTLFVAAAFLIASYQLFNLVVKDGGATRAESRAANIAYDYLRKYSASATTIPCTASTPLSNAPISVDGLADAKITITVSCVPNATTSLSKVESSLAYNNPAQKVTYAMFTSSAGSSSGSDITNGLVAWWKLNGDAATSVGSPNGIIANATSTTNQSGQSNRAYSFNGSNASITTSSMFGVGTTNITISSWIYNPSSTNSGAFIKIGDTGGYGIGIGGARFDNAYAGTKLVMLFEGVRWITTGTNVGTGWHHVVMTIDASGVPTAYLDGTSAGSYAGSGPITPSGGYTYIGASTPSGSARYFNGSIDDVRIYNRLLSLAEIQSLYSAGGQ